jgi:hypothetical protein
MGLPISWKRRPPRRGEPYELWQAQTALPPQHSTLNSQRSTLMGDRNATNGSREGASVPGNDRTSGRGKLPPKEQWTKERVQKEINESIPYGMFSRISGSFRGFTLMTTKKGQIVVRDKPAGKRKFNAAQRAHQKRFTRAATFARKILTKPEMRVLYEEAAQRNHISAHNAAMQDYLQPPVIDWVHTCGYSGNRREIIPLTVIDTIQVARVRIVIRDATGNVLEKGKPKPQKGLHHWHYVARNNLESAQTVQIEVTATDYAGNTATRTVAHHVSPRIRPTLVQRTVVWCPDI